MAINVSHRYFDPDPDPDRAVVNVIVKHGLPPLAEAIDGLLIGSKPWVIMSDEDRPEESIFKIIRTRVIFYSSFIVDYKKL